MTLDEVIRLLSRLKISDRGRSEYSDTIRRLNLSGLVLSLCDLDDVKTELKVIILNQY